MATDTSVIPYSSIARLVDYLYHDEELHYEGCFDEDGNVVEDPENHIFTHVKRVADWLDEGDQNGEEDESDPDPDPSLTKVAVK
jgi:hypothetical protein